MWLVRQIVAFDICKVALGKLHLRPFARLPGVFLEDLYFLIPHECGNWRPFIVHTSVGGNTIAHRKGVLASSQFADEHECRQDDENNSVHTRPPETILD